MNQELYLSLWKGLETGFFSSSWNSLSCFYSSSFSLVMLVPILHLLLMPLLFSSLELDEPQGPPNSISFLSFSPLFYPYGHIRVSSFSFPRVVIARRLEFSLNLCNSTNSFFIICLPLSGSPALSRLPP